MGGTNWSDDHYHDAAAVRAKSGISAFSYDVDVKSGKATGVHKSMNPKGVKFRESRDSDKHPEAHPVAVLFDVTGSVKQVPVTLQRELCKLMALLIRKGYLEHPAIMVGAIGDATCDDSPLQVGQFESGNEIENDLANLHLEGGGGGQKTESYELAMYFMANHTVTDAWEKRKKKGYLFVVGDEMPYENVNRSQVEQLIGEVDTEGKKNVCSTEEILKKLRQQWEVYFILPNLTSYYNDSEVINKWKSLLGQNFLKLDDPEGICQLIAGIVGVAEGNVDTDDLKEDLKEAGTSDKLVSAVTKALVPVSGGYGKVTKRKKGGEISLGTSKVPSGIEIL